MSTNANFSEAIEALKEGKRVRCQEWPLDKKFIFLQVPSTIEKSIVPKMQSLPQSVKDYFQTTFDATSAQIDNILYCNQIAAVGFSNLIESYNPTCRDVMCEYWEILD